MPSVQTQVRISFRPADLAHTRYRGWIAERMAINAEKRLLQLDLDMILDPFVNRPGKQWWAGEHVGKFLHAATHAWLFTGDERLKARLDSTVGRLIGTQLENGYLGTYKESDQFRQGDGLGWDGPVWDVWTHKYTLIGLLAYYQATDHEPALTASMRAADLMYDLFVVQKRSLRLASAHLGMAATSVLEPIAILYRLTGEQRYLKFCHTIVNAWEDESNPETWMYEDGCQLLTSLLDHGNVFRTANRKAYEMLSNLVGLLELYRVDPDPRYLTACTNAWNDIARNRLYLIGTASYFEQFTQDERLPPGQAVGEGCVTVTWLQLTRHLLELTGEVKYADELERTTYNALPAAQSPHTGEVSYFVPLVGHKYYNGHDVKLTPAISCCSSSIPRGIAMIPTFASGVLENNPALLLYIPGTHALTYGPADTPVTLKVEGDFPREGDFVVELDLAKTDTFTVILRVPDWASAFEATIDGEVHRPTENRLLEITRNWSSGDQIQVRIPMSVRTVPYHDKTIDSVVLLRGPQVLATDTDVDAAEGLPHSTWWGDDLFTWSPENDASNRTLRLVPFADAGQNREAYTVLQDDIES